MASSGQGSGREGADRGNGTMKPGDEAPAGTVGTGDNLCPVCSGRGRVDGRPCDNCAGTGVVTEGIGGG